jgi:hypothetical protein
MLGYLLVYLKVENQAPYAAVYDYMLNILHPKLDTRCYGPSFGTQASGIVAFKS